jgi:hypothetical protein
VRSSDSGRDVEGVSGDSRETFRAGEASKLGSGSSAATTNFVEVAILRRGVDLKTEGSLRGIVGVGWVEEERAKGREDFLLWHWSRQAHHGTLQGTTVHVPLAYL